MYNQYEDYSRIPVLLQRFSFEEKVRICHQYSIPTVAVENGAPYSSLLGKVLPWTLETFFLFSIESKEYNNNDFQGNRNEQKFIHICNAIWNHEPNVLEINTENYSCPENIMTIMGITQSPYQEYVWFRYYRYKYIFNFINDKINMPKVFSEFYGTDYDEFLKLGIYYLFLFSLEETSNKIYTYLYTDYFKNASSALTISRKDYIKQLHNFATPNEMDHYMYCVRPSYQYPFVTYDNKIYFPLPHLLPISITSSLLYRLTEGNNSLRDLIGKNILEQYLFDIIKESGVYDKVESEVTYNRGCSRSPDVLALWKDQVLLLDSKAYVPHSKIRIFDNETIDTQVNRLADDVKQLYERSLEFDDYNPFLDDEKIDKNNIWGIVVVLEDSYISRNIIYDKVAEKLALEKESEDFIWLSTHIKLVDLYQIERLSFCSNNLIESLMEMKRSRKYSDYCFLNSKLKNKISYKKVQKFIDDAIDIYKRVTTDLITLGLIK